MKSHLLVSILMLVSLSLAGQNKYWHSAAKKDFQAVKKKQEETIVYPKDFLLISIELEMEEFVNGLPSKLKRKKGIEDLPRLTLPLPDGTEMSFQVEEASIMHPDLQAKFPQIRSFVGYNQKTGSRLRFDHSHKGYHFQMITDQGVVNIEPAEFQDKKLHKVYHKSELVVTEDKYPFVCGFDDSVHLSEDYKPGDIPEKMLGDNDLRSYRLAVACTGEYTAFHGGSSEDAMAAINTTVNRVIGIYENDFSITFTLVANNNLLIYLDAASDPYSNGNASTMISQNVSNTNSVIGSSNYDIGHLFGTSGSGLAYLNGPCGNNKARAVSAVGNPTGDAFDVDYVCHEMGHQFGAHHTQYNACNRTNSTSMEPGSASTIMGYAGICSPNVQSNSDPYFHAISIEEVKSFTTSGNGNTCPTITDLGNNIPSVSAGIDHTIPKSTPFILDAIGSDADGDNLTYCWEQMDNTGTATQPPVSSNTDGPMFRTLVPSVDSKRYIPSLVDVINGTSNQWEVLPSVARDINFRVTLRDNSNGNGLSDFDDMRIVVDDAAGPFVVLSPNTSTTWSTGETKSITWDVAGTDQAPVSCSQVDILLSLDGGQTFGITLASNVSNNGTANIIVPEGSSETCRVRIKCSNNIFYDISDENFGLNVSILPNYCEITFNNNSCSTSDYIDDVVFGSINNTATGCATDGVNYSDYKEMKTQVEKGQTYSLTVKPSASYAEYFGVYIDWNLDGDFVDLNEFFDIGHIAAGQSASHNITVPNGLELGDRLFRVVARYGTAPLTAIDGCGTGFNYGEIEDYKIEVVSSCIQNVVVMTNYGLGMNETISAGNNISAANILMSGSNITYLSESSINLNIGFEVKAGAIFEAKTGDCIP